MLCSMATRMIMMPVDLRLRLLRSRTLHFNYLRKKKNIRFDPAGVHEKTHVSSGEHPLTVNVCVPNNAIRAVYVGIYDMGLHASLTSATTMQSVGQKGVKLGTTGLWSLSRDCDPGLHFLSAALFFPAN